MRPTLALAVFAAILPACNGDGGGSSSADNLAALKNVGSVVVLQRMPRMGGIGNVFDYTSYVPGAKLLKLSPATPDGALTTLCCDAFPEMAGLDIQSYDISFDAKSIVFAGRITGDSHYGLFLLTLNDKGEAAGAPRQLATDPNRDYVGPIFAPKDRIVFVTNEVVGTEALGTPQHSDEYDRQTSTQLGSISIEGTDEQLGARNVSHRTAPTMLADGRVLFTQWDHLGERNEGNLMIVNPDLTTLREGFGKEGKGVTNSYLKAVEIEPYRLVAIGTSRDRTLQAGKLLDIHLGEMVDGQMLVSEAHSHAVDLTPDVPGSNDPSADTVGRYYDAFGVKRLDGTVGDKPLLLVSWANGPVEEEILGMADESPDFGIYLYDSATRQRLPILNTQDHWEIMAKPLSGRAAPAMIDEAAKNGISDQSVLVGALNVSDTSLGAFPADRPLTKVRIIEGFSTEEGIPRMFGLTESDGAARLGEVDIMADGSFASQIPANVSVHMQALDTWAMSVRNEDVWISGRGGESRFCGGCHEDRTKTSVITPGVTMAMATGQASAFNFSVKTRTERQSRTDFSRPSVFGVPWDLAVQKVFEKYACDTCHNGTPSAFNKSLTITDTLGNMQTITFDLRSGPADYVVGGEMISGYMASHLSLLGTMTLELDKKGLMTTGTLPVYLEPQSAHDSLLFKYLNPREIYAKPGQTPRFFCEVNDCSVTGIADKKVQHPADVGGTAVSDEDMYLLILSTDMGSQYYSRENAPGSMGY